MTSLKESKGIWFSLAVIALVVVSIAVLNRPSDTPVPPKPTDTENLGGNSPVSGFDYECVGSVCTYHEYVALGTATSTPCSILSPAATSTLVRTDLRIAVASSTATTWHVATAVTAFATTTNLFTHSLSSGVQGTMTYVATTTSTDGKDVIPPSRYIVWGANGFAPNDATKLTGYCSASFRVL